MKSEKAISKPAHQGESRKVYPQWIKQPDELLRKGNQRDPIKIQKPASLRL